MEVELDSGEMVLKNVENQLTGEQLLSKYALESSDKQQNDAKNTDPKAKLSVKDSISSPANRPITPHNVKHSQVFINKPSSNSKLADNQPILSKQSVTLNGKLKFSKKLESLMIKF